MRTRKYASLGEGKAIKLWRVNIAIGGMLKSLMVLSLSLL